jgi:hypothetical protein
MRVLAALGVDAAKFKKRNGKPAHYGSCPIYNSKNLLLGQ